MIGLLLSGCGGNTFLMKESTYVEPSAPNPDEMLIYVFREDSSFGAARKFAIIADDTITAVLTPGTFSYFKAPAGEYEIVAYISPSPIMHYRALAAPGKTIYLYCKMGYASGTYIEVIDEKRAKQLMGQFKFTEIELKGQKAKMNYKTYYNNLYK
jgi:hypothetical protein